MADNRIDKLVHDSLTEPVPEDLAARLQNRSRTFVPPKRHEYRRLLAIAAMLAMSVAIVWSLRRASQPNAAYAQVVDQLRTVKTMSYTYTIAVQDGTVPIADFDMQYKHPGLLRMVGVIKQAYSITDYSKGESLHVNGNLAVYKTTTSSSLQNYIDSWLESLAHFPEHYDEDLSEEVLEGVTLHKYQVVHDGQMVLMWLDSDGALYQIESWTIEPPDGVEASHSIMTNIEINSDLPDSLFDMTPPAGYSDSDSFPM